MLTIVPRKHWQEQKKERNIFMTKPGDSPTIKKTLHELAKEFPNKTYRELEKYREEDRQQEAGTCIMGKMRKDREEPNWFPDGITFQEKYEKERKLRQEAEGELSIMKGIETNRVKEAQARCDQLQDEVDRIKRENNDLYNKIADLTESLKSKDYFKDPDYEFLVNENHRLEQQYLEVMADNKRLAREIEDQVNRMRKSGM